MPCGNLFPFNPPKFYPACGAGWVGMETKPCRDGCIFTHHSLSLRATTVGKKYLLVQAVFLHLLVQRLARYADQVSSHKRGVCILELEDTA